MIRHGNGECTYANGSKFVGRYEWDIPRHGVWFGDGWVYEGEFLAVTKDGNSTSTSLSVFSIDTRKCSLSWLELADS